MVIFYAENALAASYNSGLASFDFIEGYMCDIFKFMRTKLAVMIFLTIAAATLVGKLLGESKGFGGLIWAGIILGILLGMGTIASRFVDAPSCFSM
jgi:hypothetical protein